MQVLRAVKEFCSPTKRSAEREDLETSKRRRSCQQCHEPTDGSILAPKAVSRAIHDHASLWEPSQQPGLANDDDANLPAQTLLAEGQLEQRDVALYNAAEQNSTLVDYQLHFFLPDRLPPAPLRAPPDATVRYLQREIERRTKLPRDRLQLQVTQPGSDMKVLQEIDSAGVELHLRDHGITGPGLHNIWVILRPLPLSPIQGRPPATFAHGSPAAEYQALIASPPSHRPNNARGPAPADALGPSNARAGTAELAGQRDDEQQDKAEPDREGSAPGGHPASPQSPPNRATGAGAAPDSERSMVVHGQQSSPQQPRAGEAANGGDSNQQDRPAKKRGRPRGHRATPAPQPRPAPPRSNPPQAGDQKKRQPWTQDHLTTLIEGMEKHGTSWALILHEAGERLENRTQVDLKDKWRNVAKTVKYHRPQRKGDLSKNLKDRALQLIHILSDG